jgi:hypothetical protein
MMHQSTIWLQCHHPPQVLGKDLLICEGIRYIVWAFQSSSSGCVTQVMRNEIAVCSSGWALLHKYCSFAVRWWYISAILLSCLFMSFLTVSRF